MAFGMVIDFASFNRKDIPDLKKLLTETGILQFMELGVLNKYSNLSFMFQVSDNRWSKLSYKMLLSIQAKF